MNGTNGLYKTRDQICDLDQLRDKCFQKLGDGFKTYKGFIMAEQFQNYKKYIENLEVYDDDIWVTSCPKSGTTWLQEMVWCICNNLNFEAAKVELNLRFPFLEFPSLFDSQTTKNLLQVPSYVSNPINLKTSKRPRFIKTHLPWDLLPEQIRSFKKRPKIIHVVRDPKDVCVSFYHHTMLFHLFEGDFKEFVKLFLGDKLMFSPFDKNILSYWQKRYEPNLLLLSYEDMKFDLTAVIVKVSKFLDVNLNADQVQKLVQHLGFDAMKNNDAVNGNNFINFIKANNLSSNPNGSFIRSGVVGGYKREMSSEIITKFDEWINEKFGNSDLKF